MKEELTGGLIGHTHRAIKVNKPKHPQVKIKSMKIKRGNGCLYKHGRKNSRGLIIIEIKIS